MRLLHLVGERARVGDLRVPAWAGQPAGGGAQVRVAGHRPGERRLGDPVDRHAEVKGGLHRPTAGALLLGLVEHDVDERAAGLRVGVREDLGGDLDQVGVEAAGVPGAEDLGDLRGRVPGGVPQQVVGLGDELHVGVLDAVVYHLHEVPGAVRPDVRGARDAIHLGGDRLQHRAECLVGLG
jgi:hypothetical protein